MKVLQIIPNLKYGGAQTMVENLAIELNKDDSIEVVVVSLYSVKTPISERLRKSGIKVVFLEKRKGFDPDVEKRLYHLFQTERPDVVHTHLHAVRYAVFPAKVLGVGKNIHTVHSIASYETDFLGHILGYCFFHFFGVIPVGVSKEVCGSIARQYLIKNNRIRLVYNGVDISKVLSEKKYDTNSHIKFLHIGRFTKEKNHLVLLHAFAEVLKKYPSADLLLVGSGELEQEVRNSVNALSISDRVHFQGERDDIYNTLYETDVFVLPSLYEGLPMTLLEAMSSGLPVIASPVGGIPELVEDLENGILAQPEADDVSKAMLMLADASLRRRLGSNARKTVLKEFSSAKMAKEYQKIYSQPI